MSYRYLGNKTRLADWIVGEIERVLPRGLVDRGPDVWHCLGFDRAGPRRILDHGRRCADVPGGSRANSAARQGGPGLQASSAATAKRSIGCARRRR